MTASPGWANGVNTTLRRPGLRTPVAASGRAASMVTSSIARAVPLTASCTSEVTGSPLKLASAAKTSTESGRSYGRSIEIAVIETLSGFSPPIL